MRNRPKSLGACAVWFLWQWVPFQANFSMAVHGDGLTEQQGHHQAWLTGLYTFATPGLSLSKQCFKNLHGLRLCKAIFLFYFFFRKLYLMSFLTFPCCNLSLLFLIQSSVDMERSFPPSCHQLFLCWKLFLWLSSVIPGGSHSPFWDVFLSLLPPGPSSQSLPWWCCCCVGAEQSAGIP